MQDEYTKNYNSENPFSLSIGDLMAALLLIFALLLSASLLQLQREFDLKSKVAERYTAIKEDIYNELNDEFKYDLEKWNAVLDKKELSIRFKEPDVLFGLNETALKPKFKEILADFFPRYIKILTKPKFINTIEEVRIEGHTDTSGPTKGLNSDEDYYFNMQLSQGRTRSVLEYSLSLINAGSTRDWLKQRLTANGLSSSKIIKYDWGQEDPIASRRVEFKLRTNAEQQIDELLKYGKGKN